MNKLNTLKLACILGLAFFTSCNNDDDGMRDAPRGDYDKGTFVLNEGGSNPATASISFIDEDGVLSNDIFRAVNPDAAEIGSFLQNIFFDDTRAFIVSGLTNEVTVVDRYTFKYVATISTDLSNPRYGAVIGNFAYVTNYNDYSTGIDDFLTIISLTDYSTEKVILGEYSEKVASYEGKLIILNGYFGEGNSISFFDPVSKKVDKKLDFEADKSPNSLVIEDDKLYSIANNRGVSATLYTINLSSQTIEKQLDIPLSITSPRNLQLEDDRFYFTSENSVFSFGENDQVIVDAPLFTYTSTSGGGIYGFSVNNDAIHVADGGDFASASKTYTYSLDGNLLNTYTVGVAPNGFYKNE